MKVKKWMVLLGIAVLAFLTLFFYWKFLKTPYLTFSDAAKFADIARQIDQGKGYNTTFTIFNPSVFFDLESNLPFKTNYFPLSPLILALNFLIFGLTDSVVIFTSGLFFVLSCLLVYLIAKKLFGKLVGVLSALSFIFTGSMLEYASIGASESLFILEILLVFYLVLFENKWSLFIAGIIGVIMFATRVQAPLYVITVMALLLFKSKKQFFPFLVGMILTFVILFTVGFITKIVFFPITPVSVFFENSRLAPPNISLRGGYYQFNVIDILINIKPLLVKVFYNIYNFYKFLPALISPYLVSLYLLSLLRFKRDNFLFKTAVFFLLGGSIIIASSAIPFMRYVHPVAPLIIILSIEMLVWIVRQTFKEEGRVVVLSLGVVLFFVVGPTLGQIFLDSRYLRKNVNYDKPPIVFLLGKVIGQETKQNDLIITNVDTWGSWYGERKTVWLPFRPNQLIPPEGEKTKIDVIFLTSYLASDPAQALGVEWGDVLDNPGNPQDEFIKENFYLAKEFKIESEENYNRESVYGVILKRR